jgi:nickel superoxide dismutase
MRMTDLFRPRRVVHAHCDLPCGVYDPAQARIEAESVLRIQEMFQDASKRKPPNWSETQSEDDWQARALKIKEERADLVKHHLWVLWTDYFKPDLIEKAGLSTDELHAKFWAATKLAGESKRSQDPGQGRSVLDAIDEIDKVFKASKAA